MAESNEYYTELRKEVENSGLLNRTPVYYLIIFFFYLASFALLLWIVIISNKWHITALLAFPLASICIQLSFLGHEAGHRAISKNNFLNYGIGQITLSFITGFGLKSWVEFHNKHHAHPNDENLDPDISEGTPFSFTEKKAKQRAGIIKFITRNQAFLLAPAVFIIMLIKKYVYAKPSFKKGNRSDLIFIAMHYILFLGIVPYFIGFLQALLLYFIVSMGMGFWFGFSFLPNHLGMPTFKGNENYSFFEKQILTSRDIKGNLLLDFLTGGLNYQIEHHLFPTMSRKYLKKAKIIIKNFCKEKGIPYKDDSFSNAWVEVFRYINDVGKHAGDLFVVKAVNDMI